eukprot:TRINITY_DN62036_c0_g2_i1.p1 TRINITY_DN62036_c0_g2~~TRINITY_DN62036_c0_g2_i1.p1  ORF type:complete len:469 (-),score=38.35 TRINITY_DN62036_c0_g2_i1:186-1571(-)
MEKFFNRSGRPTVVALYYADNHTFGEVTVLAATKVQNQYKAEWVETKIGSEIQFPGAVHNARGVTMTYGIYGSQFDAKTLGDEWKQPIYHAIAEHILNFLREYHADQPDTIVALVPCGNLVHIPVEWATPMDTEHAKTIIFQAKPVYFASWTLGVALEEFHQRSQKFMPPKDQVKEISVVWNADKNERIKRAEDQKKLPLVATTCHHTVIEAEGSDEVLLQFEKQARVLQILPRHTSLHQESNSLGLTDMDVSPGESPPRGQHIVTAKECEQYLKRCHKQDLPLPFLVAVWSCVSSANSARPGLNNQPPQSNLSLSMLEHGVVVTFGSCGSPTLSDVRQVARDVSGAAAKSQGRSLVDGWVERVRNYVRGNPEEEKPYWTFRVTGLGYKPCFPETCKCTTTPLVPVPNQNIRDIHAQVPHRSNTLQPSLTPTANNYHSQFEETINHSDDVQPPFSVHPVMC